MTPFAQLVLDTVRRQVANGRDVDSQDAGVMLDELDAARARIAELEIVGRGLSISLDAARRRLAELDPVAALAALNAASED